jgi:RNA polymerase sigma-54 factor
MDAPKNALRMIPSQRLILSRAMQESLQMLQMGAFELKELIEEEIEKNPLLDAPHLPFFYRSENTSYEIPTSVSLFSSLLAQAREAFSNKNDVAIAEQIFANLDPQGYLSISLDELKEHLKITSENLLSILRVIQTFEPKGIGAQNLQQSLLIQLKAKGKENSLAFKIVVESFSELLHGKTALLQKKYKISNSILQKEILQELKKLSLRPISTSCETISAPVYPDLSLKKEQDKWIVEVIEDFLPKFYLKSETASLLKSSSTSDKRMLQGFYARGKWLMRSVNRRRKILLQIGLYIIRKQKDFLDGKAKLYPISIKEIAAELSLHESTVARACRDKYIETHFGIKPLGYFISHALNGETSAKAALEILKELLEKEDKNIPLSDQEISEKLKKQGVVIARRTVAKYRQKLLLGSQKTRKTI